MSDNGVDSTVNENGGVNHALSPGCSAPSSELTAGQEYDDDAAGQENPCSGYEQAQAIVIVEDKDHDEW
jgi:hypothetical protein